MPADQREAMARMMADPAMMQMMLGMAGGGGGAGGAGAGGMGNMANLAAAFGGGGFGGGGMGGGGGGGAPQQEPRERFAAQLQQLQAMGFPNESANLAALQMAGGNVEFAIARLLGE
jgi:ubiquilin